MESAQGFGLLLLLPLSCCIASPSDLRISFPSHPLPSGDEGDYIQVSQLPSSQSQLPSSQSQLPSSQSQLPSTESQLPSTESQLPSTLSPMTHMPSTSLQGVHIPQLQSQPPSIQSQPPSIQSQPPSIQSQPPSIQSQPPSIQPYHSQFTNPELEQNIQQNLEQKTTSSTSEYRNSDSPDPLESGNEETSEPPVWGWSLGNDERPAPTSWGFINSPKSTDLSWDIGKERDEVMRSIWDPDDRSSHLSETDPYQLSSGEDITCWDDYFCEEDLPPPPQPPKFSLPPPPLPPFLPGLTHLARSEHRPDEEACGLCHWALYGNLSSTLLGPHDGEYLY
ncbi:hypothetical protein FHG87_014591 [Trinorchestia longiramus]|nr:hypothetical protein FHG87_014591 [Trinorchestia longiramus]